MLKIGTLCWLRPPALNVGRVVEILGPLAVYPDVFKHGRQVLLPRYPITEFCGYRYAAPQSLVPFSDPDISRPEFTVKPTERVA